MVLRLFELVMLCTLLLLERARGEDKLPAADVEELITVVVALSAAAAALMHGYCTGSDPNQHEQCLSYVRVNCMY